MYFWLLNFCFIVLVWGPLVIQLKYCPVLPSLNKVDYCYYYNDIKFLLQIDENLIKVMYLCAKLKKNVKVYITTIKIDQQIG